ncbi:MAG: hypothetical protein H6808_02325 [Phycisphaera sp.]|nr:hypothetical protein [Phycisphaera sp.]
MERHDRLRYRPETKMRRVADALTPLFAIIMSVLLGSLWGTLAALVSEPYFAFVGTMIGAIMGFLFSPLLIYSSVRAGLWKSVIPIGLANSAVAFLVSAMAGEAGPLLALLVTAILYSVMAAQIGSQRLGADLSHIAGACNICGYTYLANEVRDTCPQCGEQRPEYLPPPRCLRCNYNLTGITQRCCPECGAPTTSPYPTSGQAKHSP